MLKTWPLLFTLLLFHDAVDKSNSQVEIPSPKSTGLIEEYACGGWFQFGDMCYKVGGKKIIGRANWVEATERCRNEHNGHLVAIHSRELNDFLTTFLVLNARESVWIGLHDRVNESAYTWDDGSPTNYTQWEPWEPWEGAREVEDCVELGFQYKHPWTTGNWNDNSCDIKKQFICQKPRGKFSKRNLDPRFCSPEVGGGWKLETSCYNVVEEPKNWLEAEQHCATHFKGHLVTIPDFAVNLFLQYILKGQEEDLWIGFKIKDDRHKQWFSGWPVAFENWNENETEFSEGACAAREASGKWVLWPCVTKMLPFVCEYSTAIVPKLHPKSEVATCPEHPVGWRDLGGDYCYYFDLGRTISWYEANFVCLRRGGNLASIHSEEVKVLHHFIRYFDDAIHIGLYRSMLTDDEFAWSDGSPMEVHLWDANEPNADKEQCAEVRVHNFKWNDIACTKERGYMCSRPKDFSNQTIEMHAPAEPCIKGFSSYVLIGVIFCVLFVAILVGVIVYYFRLCERGYERVKKTSGTTLPSPSPFETKPRYRSEMIIADDMYENMV